jgi:hypothetical protein
MTRAATLKLATIRADLERVCVALAPDLAKAPLYLVGSSELPRDFRGSARATVGGCTSKILDLALCDFLGPRWAGRGAAVVVNDTALRREIRTCARHWGQDARDVFRCAMLGIVLHEMSHVIDRDHLAFPAGDIDPLEVALMRRVVGDVLVEESGQEREFGIPPFRDHEWGFVRVLLHLLHRAYEAGERVAWHFMSGGRTYGIAPFHRYEAALGDEPQRMADATFAEIRATPPPASFRDLWNADASRWIDRENFNAEQARTLRGQYLIP